MAPRPPAAALMDELVEEILLRIPPDDPARLLHAALVCKRWGRIVSDPGFRRRFREFHRTPPMLGFFYERGVSSYSFVSTSSFRRPPAALRDSHQPIDARHGRVLLWNSVCECGDDGVPLGNDFMVWDPITGWSSQLPLPPSSKHSAFWNAAVLCASTNGSCDHLDCARGHFLVVYVCTLETGMFAHVYSSESGSWSEEISAQHLSVIVLYPLPSALVGNALYFLCDATVLKYDLAAREMSLIRLPLECMYEGPILRTTEGGRLGLISKDGVHLYLWSREVRPEGNVGSIRRIDIRVWPRVVGPERNVGWTLTKVIKLRKLFPDVVKLSTLRLAGFAHGLDVVLVRSSEGTFTIDLKSIRVTKVHREDCSNICLPYMSFYNPALGAASTEGSRTGTSNA